jgi:protein involved in polysaccharide export with SLBB domain
MKAKFRRGDDRWGWGGACAASVVLLLSGCVTAPQLEPPVVLKAPQLVPGLILNIRVLVDGEVEIEEEAKRVRAEGDIILPLVGRVPVAGLTLDELAAALYTLYNAKYFVEPSVVVDFVESKTKNGISPWGYVTVLGCVNSPGRVNIPPTLDLRVSQAIQQVNGFDEGARPSGIRITRKGSGDKPKRIKVDLHHAGSKGELEQDVILRAGDVVFVPESFF